MERRSQRRLEAGKGVERTKSVRAERNSGRREEGGNEKVEHTAER